LAAKEFIMNLPDPMVLGSNSYSFYEIVDGNKAVFHGPNHTDTNRQTLELIRTEPKRSGDDYGVRRGYIRVTEAVSKTDAAGVSRMGQVTSNASINWPVGADQDEEALVANQMVNIWGAVCGGQIFGNHFLSPTWRTDDPELLAMVQFFTTGQI